jgi:hypothetical protein
MASGSFGGLRVDSRAASTQLNGILCSERRAISALKKAGVGLVSSQCCISDAESMCIRFSLMYIY